MQRLFRSICQTAVIAAALIPVNTHATISLTVSADVLYADPNATIQAPTSTLLVLVADTLQNGFVEPTPTSFASGDDVVLTTWIYDSPVHELNGFTYTGNISATDPVRLYWYPTLTDGAPVPGVGTPYGKYPNLTLNPSGDSSWILPPDGTTLSDISMVTKARDGTFDEEYGAAAFTVVPEPSTWGVIAGVGCLVIGVATRRFRAPGAEAPRRTDA